MTEPNSNILQTIIDEFKTLSPETTNALIFTKDGQSVASTKATSKDQTKTLLANFGDIAQHAEIIGGVENLTIQAADSQLNITVMNNLYLATVSSRGANQEVVKSLTHVVVPAFVGLVDQIAAKPEENLQLQTVELEEPEKAPILPTLEEPTVESIPEVQNPYEPFLPKTPVNQLMVEKISGLLVQTDTVRIDSEVIENWSSLYEDKQITMVQIEALDGKKTTCKFKTIKEAKNGAKGVIQIPEKILQSLQTEKGKLVMVKPLIE